MDMVSDEFLLECAWVIGSQSAAAAAIAERDKRRKAGEDAIVFWDRDKGMLIVGPRPSTQKEEG
jgi:hypothetical protein